MYFQVLLRFILVLALIVGSWPGLLTVEAAAGDLVVDGIQITLSCSHTYDNVIVKNGGKIIVGWPWYLALTVTNTFLVDSTSAVIAYPYCGGPGDAPLVSDWCAGGGGGGYGGNGGQGDAWGRSGGPGGASYGDPANGGALIGSAGADGRYGPKPGSGGPRGFGGGRVIVRASLIQVAGKIQANGANGGTYMTGGGGGSGGGITLTADRIVLSGSVTANGGDGGLGYGGGGGGGGGRITILYGLLENSGTIAANGGRGGLSLWQGAWRGKGEDGAPGSVLFIPLDKTPPTTEALLGGTPGLNGWYTSDVQVTLSASDNAGGTGVARTEYSFDGTTWALYTAPFTLASEGSTTIFYRSADKAGNVETAKTQTIKIDKTPPEITAVPTTSPNANGWYRTDVVVHFAAADAISGLASVTPDITVSAEGAGQLVSGTATDQAGNTASAAVTLNADKTPPDISIASPTTGPYLTSDLLTVSYSAIDGLSGIDTVSAALDGIPVNNGQVINLSALAGSHSLAVMAEDKAGNQRVNSVTFTVLIAAEVEVEPETLNVASQSDKNTITAHIEFPARYDVRLIDVSSVKMEVNGTSLTTQISPTCFSDYDDDETEDLMVKFNRQAFIEALGGKTGEITVKVSGQLSDGRGFVGNDVLHVISKGKEKREHHK
ncbi:MAG: hypothetical protein M1299_13185 [Firmicutes bacterium]|nr:hypothetical protein [Bacillota bacterium]MCL5040743.1 hypothetical protein [Bacillota bacterium]